MGAPHLIIGIGNRDRGDDGAGRAVLARLRGHLAPTVVLREHDGEASGLLSLLQSARAVTLIDACVSGARAGSILRLDASRPLPSDLRTHSTHGFGLAAAIEMARALRILPRACVVYLIEGLSFALGAPLSAPVQAAVERLAARLMARPARRRLPAVRIPG